MISRISCRIGLVILGLMAAFSPAALHAQAVRGLDATRVAGGFNLPVFATAPPRDKARLFVVQQSGQIRIIDLATGTVKEPPFLSLSVSTSGEEGFLGLAFDPNYATERLLLCRLRRRRAGCLAPASPASRASPSPPIPISPIRRARKSCSRSINPKPITTAAGSGSARAPVTREISTSRPATAETPTTRARATSSRAGTPRTLTTLLGKMLRIHVEQRRHLFDSGDNPFVGMSTACARRSGPTGCAIRSGTASIGRYGTFFIGDVGQDAREEIDAEAGDPGRRRELRLAGARRQHPESRLSRTTPCRRTRSIRPTIIPTPSGRRSSAATPIAAARSGTCVGIYVFADYLGPNTGNFTGRIFTLNFNGTVASNFQDITADLFPDQGGQLSAAQSDVVRRGRQWRALHLRHREREHFPDRARSLGRDLLEARAPDTASEPTKHDY